MPKRASAAALKKKRSAAPKKMRALRRNARRPSSAKPKTMHAARRKTFLAVVMRRKNVLPQLRPAQVRARRAVRGRVLPVAHRDLVLVLVLLPAQVRPVVGQRQRRGRLPAVQVPVCKRGAAKRMMAAGALAAVPAPVALAPVRSHRRNRARLPTTDGARSSAW